MNKLINCYFWSFAFYGAEDWKLKKVDQIYLESFEILWWRRAEKKISKGRVGNEEVLHSIKGR
jgi:hypothetical protein